MIELQGDSILLDRGYRAEAQKLGAAWDETIGRWRLPASLMNASAIHASIPGSVDLRAFLAPSGDMVEDPRLFVHQRKAIPRLVDAKHGAIAVLPPGYGKTAVAVMAADEAVPSDRVVVVAPASLLRTWEREIYKWQKVPGKVYIVEGEPDWSVAQHARWLVTSWDRVVRNPDLWKTPSVNKWPLWILDESVMAKSRASQRRLVFSGGQVKKKGVVVKSFTGLRKVIDRFWLLSGSPTTRYADDLWAQLNLLWPRAYPSYWRFAERYCIIEETPWARKITGTRRDVDAAEENADLIISIDPDDLLDLPEYLFEPPIDVVLTPTQRKAYTSMQDLFIADLENGNQVLAVNEIAQLVKLQQIASFWDGKSAKHDALVELLPQFEGPHLIWTHWKEGAHALYRRLNDKGVSTSWVSGDDPAKVRDHEIEAFKNGQRDALILSMGVGKFGHTLTNAKTVHWVDKTWNADDYFQALHRVRRIGLEHRPVSITYRAPGTVDELVELNLEGKLGSISSLTRSDLATLLKGLR